MVIGTASYTALKQPLKSCLTTHDAICRQELCIPRHAQKASAHMRDE